MTLMHPEIKVALDLAEAAGWPRRTDKGRIYILPPDGKNLTVGMRPNEASLTSWRSTCRKYNLVGDGPAMTPAEQEAKAMKDQNPTPDPQDPAKAKKSAEAKVAKEKADAVVAAAEALPTPPPSPAQPVVVPVVTHTKVTPATIAEKAKKAGEAKTGGPERDQFGFPPFSPEMLVLKDYSVVKLPNGKYFCPNCWSLGERKFFKQPQGVASHRGFRHALFVNAADVPGDSEVTTLLPESLVTALELLRNEMVEVYAGTIDAAEVEELKAKIDDLNKVIDGQKAQIAERDVRIKNLGSDLDKQIKLANERGVLLDGTKDRQDREIREVMEKVGKDFTQFREWINALAPARAMAKIDQALDKYLGE